VLLNVTVSSIPLPLVWYRKHDGDRISTSGATLGYSHFRAALPFYMYPASVNGLGAFLLYVKGLSMEGAKPYVP
jgi:hypothetical protein